MVRASFNERQGYVSEVISWDLTTGQPLPTVRLEVAGSALFNGVIDPTGRTIVDGRRVIDAGTGRLIATLEGPADTSAGAPRFSANGRFVAMIVSENPPTDRWFCKVLGVWVWETRTGRLVGRFPDMVGQYPTEPNRSYRLTPDGRHLVTVGPTGLVVREVTTGNLVLVHPQALHDSWSNSLDVSPDGRKVVIANVRKSSHVWDSTVRK
jgi:hypothetical protein